MKKVNLLEIVLGIVGGLTYSMGLCMYLIKSWDAKPIGTVITLIGMIMLFAIIPIHIKYHEKKTKKEASFKDKCSKVIGVFGLILLIVGFVVMFGTTHFNIGNTIATIGLLTVVLNYPIYNWKGTVQKLKATVKSKKTYLNLMMAVGAILFATGMAMTIINEWNMLVPGTVLGLIGAGLIILKLYLDGREEKKKEFYVIDVRSIVFVCLGVIGAALIAFGLIKITGFDEQLANKVELLLGLLLDYIGFCMCTVTIPLNQYLKSNDIWNKNLIININDKEHNYTIKNLWLMFVLYGFLGWVVEFIVCGVEDGNFVNRGFLHITLLPVWGLGGALVSVIFKKSQRFVFTKSTIYLSFLEYITSIILEVVFHNKWWDYSTHPFNVNGRICLLNCLMFGVAGFMFSKYVSPFVNEKLNRGNKKALNSVAIVTVLVFCIDLGFSLFSPNTGVGITG